MICAVADDLFPRPTCQGVKVQGVKVSSLISIALLWRPRARLPPRMVFFSRKDPRLLRDTSPQQSPAALLSLSVDHEQKKFWESAEIRAR
jgi:hypothetical protein